MAFWASRSGGFLQARPILWTNTQRCSKLKILRLKAVIEVTGLSRSLIYKLIALGTFPQSVSLTGRAVGWPAHEVDAWISARIEERDEGKGAV